MYLCLVCWRWGHQRPFSLLSMYLWYNGDGHQRPCLLLGLVESLPCTYVWFAGDGDTNVLFHSLACTYGIMEMDTNVLVHSLDSSSPYHVLMFGLLEMGTPTSFFTP